jgi:guanine nucleotide-binding protein G(i) subunit alpha
VWENTIHHEAISGKVAILLFLNKIDLFTQRLHKQPKSFKKAFKDFQYGNDVGWAVNYLRKKFLARVHRNSRTKPEQIFTHTTCALDTSQIAIAFSSVKDFVVQQRMKCFNLM